MDVVAESSGVFYDDLTPEERRLRGFQPGSYSWENFRNEVYGALNTRYSQGRVRLGNKCIHVGGTGDRLNADVIPYCEYRAYGAGGYAKGITFWTRSGIQVVNYPQLHYESGTRKNNACGGNYKAMTRVFKSARNAAGSDLPSYFLECLLYNVSSFRFSGNHQSMFHGILVELLESSSNGSKAQWMCQNGVQWIYGGAMHQTDLSSANRLLDALLSLWSNWR
ncbi:MAG: hypothetical protein OXI01_15300 [Albidovulum sp.]|nr:hypothetical protein [Albidovulum sp.]